MSSGLDEAACLAQIAKADAERLPAFRRAVEALPSRAREAVGAVRERVAQDRLPLLSLLQVEPLQMQSSHLSFQASHSLSSINLSAGILVQRAQKCSRLPSVTATPVLQCQVSISTNKIGSDRQEVLALPEEGS